MYLHTRKSASDKAMNYKEAGRVLGQCQEHLPYPVVVRQFILNLPQPRDGTPEMDHTNSPHLSAQD